MACVDDDVIDALGVDVRPVVPGGGLFSDIEFKDMGHSTYLYDNWKIGWRMPKDGGMYYDMFDNPLAGNITEEDLDRFPWFDPLDPRLFEGLREAVRQVTEVQKRAAVITQMAAGTMEVAAWMRGYVDFYTDLGANHPLVAKLLSKINEIKLAQWSRVLDEVGDCADVLMMGDDYGGQDRLLMSPKTWRKLIKPGLKEICDLLHSKSDAKVFLHCCGAIREIIPDLIEVGVDILNPIQVSAAGMDTAELKREFGKDIVFWGGGVDTQRVLWAGTPDEVRAEVRHRLDDLMPGGGFVFAATHNIQGDVPAENLVAMWETLRECGVYSAG
jgi:uroporphyrinogen decarboxylase